MYEILAYASETLVFLFLGIGLLVFRHPFQTMGWGTLFSTVINLNVARFLNIFICTLIVNRFRTEQTKFSAKTQFVMWFSGLRGAMAYAIALQAAVDFPTNNIGQVILIDTLVYS